MTDEELVYFAQKGDNISCENLLEKYKSLVRSVTRMFFITGADNEDLLQEGMIGLYKAVLSFSSEKNILFSSYAEICIKRQVLSAIKTANRMKHMPLNSYISINKEDEEGNTIDERYNFSINSDDVTDPEEIAINHETNEKFHQVIESTLSEFEKKVLYLFFNGDSYAEIAKALNKDSKAVNNALQRIKRKLKAYLS